MSPTSYQTAPPRISIIATLGGSVKRRAKAELSRAVIEGSDCTDNDRMHGDRTQSKWKCRRSACERDSEVRNSLVPVAARARRARAVRDDRATQPVARRYHDAARSLQEVTLAGCRADFLSTAPAV